jgi:uncharacterized RDD family membrane protein YckC
MDYQEYVVYEPILARRAFAALIDYGIYFGIFYAIVYFFGDLNSDGTRTLHGFGNLFILFFIWFVLFPGLEGFLGYTLGKGLLDLKIVCERKQDTPLGASFKRHIVDFIDFFLFGAVAIILVKTSSEHKRIGDHVAHTHVVLDK